MQSKRHPNLVTAKLDVAPPSKAGDINTEMDGRKGIQSVDLAFSVLRAIEEANSPISIKDLSAKLGMPAPKAHHYLVSLVRSGAVRQTDMGLYELGAYALQLGMSALRRLDAVAQAVKAAASLRAATGEAVFIAVWGSHGPTTIRFFEGDRPVAVEVRVGMVMPLLTSATGRVFLTWGRAVEVAPLLKQELASTEFDPDVLREDARSTGLGIVEGTLLPRISSMSAPVFDKDGNLALALTVLGWIGEIDIDPAGATAEALRETASSLSAELGYFGADQLTDA